MSALHRSIGARLLPAVLRPTARTAAVPQYRTYASGTPSPTEEAPKTTAQDAPTSKQTTETTQIRTETAKEGMSHRPDYNVAIDYRTSYGAALPPSVCRD
jgi:NADH dehydrogenase (ubiquinone) Fe-S protein 4